LVIDPEEAVAAPAGGGKPGARADDRWRRGHRRDRVKPAVEPGCRRAGIQAAFSLAVLPAIQKHVNQAVADLPGRGERPGVISVAPDSPSAAEGAVHGAGDTGREAADSAGQVLPVLGFDKKMEMIVLCGKLDDPEPLVRGGGDGTADSRKDATGPETADGWRGS